MEGTLQAEMEALVGSGTIRRVKVEQLTDEPGYDRMEVAPAKIVPTIKSPLWKAEGTDSHLWEHGSSSWACETFTTIPDGGDHGCHRSRGTPSSGGGPAAAADLYAGGVDATALRCVLRKAAGASWSLASTDVRGAFLLAARSQTRRPLLVVEPPRLLTSTGLIPADEQWICDGAMYGLDTSPADWASFRDHRMSSFRWETPTHRCQLSRSRRTQHLVNHGCLQDQLPGDGHQR